MSHHSANTTSPPLGGRPPYASPVLTTSSWGTVHGNPPPKNASDSPSGQTLYSFGVPSHYSWSPAPSVSPTSVPSEYGHQSVHDTQGSWPVPLPLSPPSPYGAHSVVSSGGGYGSGSHTHTHGNTLPNSAVCVHPSLQCGRTPTVDLAYMPTGANSLPGAQHERAFNPPTIYAHLVFPEHPHWSLRIHAPQGITVQFVLEHLYYYLQMQNSDTPQNAQAMRTGGASAADRDRRAIVQSSTANGASASQAFYQGPRRVEVLGRKRVFAGLSPVAGGQNVWCVYFAPCPR